MRPCCGARVLPESRSRAGPSWHFHGGDGPRARVRTTLRSSQSRGCVVVSARSLRTLVPLPRLTRVPAFEWTARGRRLRCRLRAHCCCRHECVRPLAAAPVFALRLTRPGRCFKCCVSPLDATMRSSRKSTRPATTSLPIISWFWLHTGPPPAITVLAPRTFLLITAQPPRSASPRFYPLRDDGERYAARFGTRCRVLSRRSKHITASGSPAAVPLRRGMLDTRRSAPTHGAHVTAAPHIELPILDEKSLLFLHGDDGPLAAQPFVDALRALMTPGAELAAPVCPGWSGEPLPVWLRTVDQLAYHYLDAVERVATTPITAIGASFGAWLLLEMATKQPQLFSDPGVDSPVASRDHRETRISRPLARDSRATASLFASRKLRCNLPRTRRRGTAAFASPRSTARFGWDLPPPVLRHRLPA